MNPKQIIDFIDSRLKGNVVPLDVERDAIQLIEEYADSKRFEKQPFIQMAATEYNISYEDAEKIRAEYPNNVNFLKAVEVFAAKDPETDPDRLFNQAWSLLEKKGLKLSEKFMVRKAFAQWGKDVMNDVTFDHKGNYYKSEIKAISSYAFDTKQEVLLFNALYNFMPEANPEKLLQILAIIFKLTDYESEWKFKITK